jgi:hypothetical protein
VEQEKPLVSFQQLSSIAASLNKASDEFTKVVSELDASLQRLNVGLVVWVTVVKLGNGSAYEIEQIGYAKVDGNWRIAIRKLRGNEESEYEDVVTNTWAFNDAPRQVRLRSVEKLPELVSGLAKAAVKATQVLNKKLAETKAFAAAIGLRDKDDEKGPNNGAVERK